MNTQLVEKPVRREDGALDVVSTFLTIQGEGPHTGETAVFVRLAGCNRDCPLCDTQYTVGRRLVSALDLTAQVRELMPHHANLVVLTGGEPLRQHVLPFIEACYQQRLWVQIETNGTTAAKLPNCGPPRLTVVCSPKAPKVVLELTPFITAYKYVIRAGEVDEADGLPTTALGLPVPPARPHAGFVGLVYAQPCDDGDPTRNTENLRSAAASCLKFGYRLGVQLHKLAGLD